MKSRISFFNPTVFRKDTTRFAPTWGIYLVGGFLVMHSTLMHMAPQFAADYLVEALSIMALLNCGYALLCAQLLFGDLFNTRLCNALHAMPLRREGWFLTHLAAGFSFSFVPNLVLALSFLPGLQWGWAAAFLWLLGMTLEFMFFFAMAVFCVLCTGSRFAMAVFYGLLNFLAPLAEWFTDVVYSPLLPGVTLNFDWLEPFSPLNWLINHNDWMSWYDKISRAHQGIGECWRYLIVLTGLGLILYGAALALYRRRKLECAGDFVAVRALGPIFLVVYTLMVGVVFQLFDVTFINYSSGISLSLIVGLAVGYFTGQMLLKRTVRVFQKRTFAGFAVMAALIVASMAITWLDPIGVTRWVPEVGEVSAVQITGLYSYADGTITLHDVGDVQEITQIHALAIDEQEAEMTEVSRGGDEITLNLCYQLSGGKIVRRCYTVSASGEAGQRLVPFLSDPEDILCYEDWDAFLNQLYQIRIDYNDEYLFTGEDARSLAEAIKRDCEAGDMVQFWQYHEGQGYKYSGIAVSVDIIAGDRQFDVSVYYDCQHTIQWLKDHHIDYFITS